MYKNGANVALFLARSSIVRAVVETSNVKIDGLPSAAFHLVGNSATMGGPMAGIQEDS